MSRAANKLRFQMDVLMYHEKISDSEYENLVKAMKDYEKAIKEEVFQRIASKAVNNGAITMDLVVEAFKETE